MPARTGFRSMYRTAAHKYDSSSGQEKNRPCQTCPDSFVRELKYMA